jgi:large subunit ribosomal protein L19
MDLIRQLEKENAATIPLIFKTGDTVRVYVKTFEGGKERIQPFEGVVLKIQGGGLRQSFTVRRMVQGVGVEKTFMLHSPIVSKITIRRKGLTRRAKIYYLRGRRGSKESRIKAEEE